MTNQEDVKLNTPGVLRIFVYGTLKRNMWNHDRYCAGALSIEEAVVRGRLYEMDCGLPVLQVPETDILAHGTADPRADVATQARFEVEMPRYPDPRAKGRAGRGWRLVRGELMTFDDPEERLPHLDYLEGYRPGGPSLYRRFLLCVHLGNMTVSAWAYVSPPEPTGCKRLFSRTCYPRSC